MRLQLMLGTKKISWACGILLIIALCQIHCASQVSPKGGEPDKIPPTVKKTNPENQSLNVESNSISFQMSESIKLPSYSKEVFISPLLERRPSITLNDNTRRLRIKFQEELRPQTTYVISLSGITDYYSNNPMTGSFIYAFSTGDQLDSMKLNGKVLKGGSNAPETDILLLLFDADSIIDNDIFRKLPAYVSKTGEDGSFTFQYLRQIPYRIYGIKDADQSNTYSQPAELIALAEEPYVVLKDSTQEVTLFSSLPDNQPPILKNYAWLDDSTLTISFDEVVLEEDLRFSLTDSSGQDTSQLAFFTRIPNTDNEFLFRTSRLDSSINQLVIQNIQDSLQNRADSSIIVRSSRTRTMEEPVYLPPAYNLRLREMEFYSNVPFREGDTTFVFISDTTKYDYSQIDTSEVSSDTLIEATYPNRFPASFQRDGFRVAIIPEGDIPVGKPMLLHVNGQISGLSDSSFTYSLSWPDPKEFGTLSGSVSIKNYEGPLIVELVSGGKRADVTYDSIFSFSLIQPGNYQIRVTLDEDSNQTWTPGSLSPYRLPEKILLDSRQENIRANWDIEDYIVEMDPNQVPIPVTDTDTTLAEDPNR